MIFDKELFVDQHEELKAFLAENRRRYTGFLVEKIVNLGTLKFYDEPLFLISNSHVLRFYWNGYTGSLRFTLYGREEFFRHVEGFIFRDPELLEDGFDEFCSPYSNEINAPIQSISLSFDRYSGKRFLKQINVRFAGKELRIAISDTLPDTMDSMLFSTP